MSKRRQIEAAAHGITKELVDRGLLIEAGFALFAHYVISKDAPQTQLSEMRLAFMAGAEHVWNSALNILDPGEEPTEADMKRMDMIQKELDTWRVKLSERIDPAKGRA